MGLRFRKSMKLAGGVRINFTGSGISWTLGPKGASVGVGKRGVYLNTGIPGTGLYARERIGNLKSRASSSAPLEAGSVSVKVVIEEDGSLNFFDSNDKPLSQHLINAAKKQQAGVIRKLMEDKCNEINSQAQALGEIHLGTPNPNFKPEYHIQEFAKPEPEKPYLKEPGFFNKLFGNRSIENENQNKEAEYLEKLNAWQVERRQFEELELKRKMSIEKDIYSNVEAMENFLEESLQSIIWPRETYVSAEILDEGRHIFIDVDLPEIEDIPNITAGIPQRGYKLSLKKMTERQLQQLYMKHIHGIGFRIIGEAFHALPNSEQITLSAYSQRADPATGHIADAYLYSVQVERKSWVNINFDSLQSIDIVEALTQFNIRRKMTKTGKFQPIQPFSPSA